MAVNSAGISMQAGTVLTTVYTVPGNAKYAYVKCLITNINVLNPNAKVSISAVGGSRNASLVKDAIIPHGKIPINLSSFTMNPGEALQVISDFAATILLNVSVGEVL